MNEFYIDDYLVNPESWNFSQQHDYSINPTQFVELSNVHSNISLLNETNLNTINLSSSSPPSSMIYDLPLPQNSSSNLRLKKHS